MPVYISGNAYFNGARPYGKEQLRYVDTENRVYFSLIEKDGSYYFSTNLYDYLPRMETEMISTSMLGMSFETEQPYEEPDGSPVRIDEDFLGRRRGQHPTPGPFEYTDMDTGFGEIRLV